MTLPRTLANRCGRRCVPSLQLEARQRPPGLAPDDVLDFEDLGVTGKLDADVGEDWHEALTERLKLLACRRNLRRRVLPCAVHDSAGLAWLCLPDVGERHEEDSADEIPGRGEHGRRYEVAPIDRGVVAHPK